MKIEWLPLKIEDFEEIRSLWARCPGVGWSSADSRENIRNFLLRNPGMSFTAVAEGRIIGTILAGHDQRRGVLYHLAVDPEYRRQGLGQRLVERSLQALEEAGVSKCHLFLLKENAEGLRFWTSVGWEQRTDLVMMSRSLNREEKENKVLLSQGVVADPGTETIPRPYSLRPMAEADWPAVRTIYTEGMATGKATFEKEPPSWEEWDAAHVKDCRLVAVVDERVIGWVALSRVSSRDVYTGVAEVSIYVAAAFWGRGIGTALLRAVIRQSEEKGFWTLQAGIFTENEASIRLHQKMGFRLIGCREKLGRADGRWRDVLLFERRSQVVGI